MRYVGLDAHLRQSTFCVLDARGRKVMTRTVMPNRRRPSRLNEAKRPALRQGEDRSQEPKDEADFRLGREHLHWLDRRKWRSVGGESQQKAK